MLVLTVPPETSLPQLTHFVIKYPDGRFQGHASARNGRFIPRVPFSEARLYSTTTAARRSVAYKGGEVVAVACVLLSPEDKTDE